MKRLNYILFCALMTALAGSAAVGGDIKSPVEKVSIEKSGASISISGRVIEFSTDAVMRFEVYSITGQLVKTVTVTPTSPVRVELAKGFYIVKCESWTRRVMLK